MSEELKTCPFCLGKPSVSYLNDGEYAVVCISCEECGASSDRYLFFDDISRVLAIADTLEKWNRRP